MQHIPRAHGGLKVMGSAAQGEFECRLGPMQLRMQPAADRMKKALSLATRLESLLLNSKGRTSLHEAWCMTVKCVKEALAYDVSIIPREVVHC